MVWILSRGLTQSKDGMLDTVYNMEDRKRILSSINTCSEEELLSTRLFTRTKSKAIINYREKNGAFENLNSLLSVPGIGLLGLQRACDVLKKLDAKGLQILHEKSAAVQVYPHLSKAKQKTVESVVAMDIQGDRVTWAKVSRDLHVDDWNQSLIFDRPFLRYDHVLFHNSVKKFLEQLPEASLYIMENKVYRYTNIRIVPFITNLRILEAVIVTLLNGADENKIYLMKSQILSSFFNLSVGGERVSGKHIVQDIIDEKSTMANGVILPSHLVNVYSQYDAIQQDKFASCLLLAIALYKLVILKP
ncbi:hypothetical protein ScPMuIL_004880 [Solemya velum]